MQFSPIAVPSGEPSARIILILLSQYLRIGDKEYLDTIWTVARRPLEALNLIDEKFIVEYRHSENQAN